MKLFYRGTSFEYDPSRSKLGNTGRPARPAQTSQTPYTLIYRGLTYEVDPTAPAAKSPALPTSYELIYRGTVYEVNRNAQGAVSMTTRPAGAAQSKPVLFPSALPRQYVAKMHQSNLLKNLQHRIQVAQEHGDQKLIALLESELKQLAVSNY